jgi:hypothetical protein
MPSSRRHLAAAIVWFALAVVFALGGAGLINAANPPPIAGSRPELTYVADLAIEPELKAAAGDLAALSDDVDGLGTIGRAALTSLVDRDTSALRKSTADGKAQLDLIAGATDALRARLAAIPGIGPDDRTRIGTSLRIRYDKLVGALTATDDLSSSWSALTAGSIAAIELTDSLSRHDIEAAAAGTIGRKGMYKKALATLDLADKALATSSQLRDKLATTTDVTILTTWIDRNAAYDAALRKTWTLLSKSKGRVTKPVEAAFVELRAAQAALPADSRALVVIMADVARGGLNQAVIEIEEARGRLAAAAESLDGG